MNAQVAPSRRPQALACDAFKRVLGSSRGSSRSSHVAVLADARSQTPGMEHHAVVTADSVTITERSATGEYTHTAPCSKAQLRALFADPPAHGTNQHTDTELLDGTVASVRPSAGGRYGLYFDGPNLMLFCRLTPADVNAIAAAVR